MAVLLSRRAVLQAAIETTYGVEKSVTAADAIYVENPDYSVDVTVLERNFTRNDISGMPSIAGRKLASIKFTTEVRGNGIQHSGSAGDQSILTRLFRGCGFALTAMASVTASAVKPLGEVANNPTWVTAGTLDTDELVAYTLEVVTGGASETAEIKVTSDLAGESSVAAVVTSESAFTVGTKGLTVEPTFTGDLREGDRWIVYLYPTGARLDPVSSGFESLTMKLNMDGVEHKMLGAFGTATLTAEAGQYAKAEFTFTGTYEEPTDVTMPDGVYETALPQMVELARLRVDDFYAIVNALSLDIGNDIQVRPDVSSSDGYIGTRIVSRTVEGGIDPEADLVASENFWSKLATAKRMPFQMRIGAAQGNTVWVLSPSTQYTGLTYGDRNGIRTYDAGLRFSRVTGNDEVQFVFT